MIRILAAGLLALLLPAFARAAPAAPRLEIAANPKQLELSAGVTAALRIQSVEPPTVSASVGTVRDVQLVSKGVYEAVYVAPEETYPQVAILVARTPRATAWTTLPLLGSAEVTVSPDASGSASVTVGGRRFGPEKAGADGKVVLKIVVPPGIESARTSAGKTVKLGAPPVAHVFVTVEPDDLPANVSGSVQLRVYAITPEGRPRRGAPVKLSVDPGSVSATREIAPGVYQATWTLPPSVTASVQVGLEDERPGLRTTLQRRDPEPKRLRIEVSREVVPAGEPLDFTLILDDGAGRAVEGTQSPRASLSTGTFLGWSRGPPGHWIGHVSVPERLEAATLVIAATAGELVARREVKLVAGPAATVDLLEVPDMQGEGTLAFTLLDRFGNETDVDRPALTATGGTIASPARRGPGRYEASFVPLRGKGNVPGELRIEAGRLTRTVSLEAPSRAPRAGSVVFGPKVGYTLGTGSLKSLAVGAELGFWSRSFGVVLDGRWFRFDRTDSVAGSDIRVSSRANFFGVDATLAWRHPLAGGLLTAGAGGGAVLVSASATATGTPEQTSKKTVPAAHGTISWGAPAGPGMPFLELRGDWQADPGEGLVRGSLTSATLNVGYRFNVL